MDGDHQLRRCSECFTTYAVISDETVEECAVCGGSSIEDVNLPLEEHFEKFTRD